MKNLFFSLVATVAISAFAAAQTTFVKMALPKTMQSTSKNFETVTKTVTVYYKDGTKKSGQMRFAIPDDGFGLVSAEFDQQLVDGKTITSNFFVTYENALLGDTDEWSLRSCIQGCQEKYTNSDGTKIKGRGACKFDCWVQAFAGAAQHQIIPAVTTFLLSLL